MNLVIANYKKYGDPMNEKLAKPMPPPATQSVNAEEPEWPEKDKVTLKWLKDYMPMHIWVWLAGAFFTVASTAFGFGYWAGSTLGIKPEIQNTKSLPTPTPESTKVPPAPMKNKSPNG
jgi:hypothetical protein